MTTLNPVTVKPNELKDGDKLGFKVIAVISANGKLWTAYRGLTHWSDEEVASHGDALSPEIARGLFYAPVAANIKYYW